MRKVLAFDYGASSGRGILGCFDGEKLTIEEIHRFNNDPVMVNDSFYWDILRLYHEMKQGIFKCIKNGHPDISAIGIDTWGVDFGLLDKEGNLLGNPYHYRDGRTDGMIEKAAQLVSKNEIYRQTGIAFQKFNTLYQLLSMKLNNPSMLEKAETLLFMPDLLNYFLTGVKATEYTIASTAQMLDPIKGDWAFELLEKLGLPKSILTEIVDAGSIVGPLRQKVCDELGISGVQVISVASHDTGSAVVSVPAAGDRFLYLSSGTWSLMGVELEAPVISQDTYSMNYTNEGGINRTTRLLKNIMGLWIFQECKRAWDKSGNARSFDELEMMADQSQPFKAFIDPDADIFYSPGNMPSKVVEYCRATNQAIPATEGEIVRCIMESLAMKYRMTAEGLEKIVGYPLPVINIVGGGCKNIMLSQFTADATGKKVVAGPVEATAVGNIICQLMALGDISSLKEARAVIAKSFPTVEYNSNNKDEWDEAYSRFRMLNKFK